MDNLRTEDIFHKSQLLRLLIEIVDTPLLAQSLAFKGGTCAAMSGYLDRFSVDLDFDVLSGADEAVAVLDRYSQHGILAARDIYDIHHFFIQGYIYKGEIIRERTGLAPTAYFKQLVQFIKKQVTVRVIDEDLNSLLPYPKFQQIRKILVPETIALLEREIAGNAV